MQAITLAKLAHVVRGAIVFGQPPPLRGELETPCGFSLDSGDVKTGEVYFHLPGYPQPHQGCWPHEAFGRGALAVVTCQGKVEPWAGAARVDVPDVAVALHRLAQWIESQRPAISVTFWGRDAQRVARVVASVADTSLPCRCDRGADVASSMWRSPTQPRPQLAILNTSDPYEIQLALALGQPNLLVVTESAGPSRLTSGCHDQGPFRWQGAVMWPMGDKVCVMESYGGSVNGSGILSSLADTEGDQPDVRLVGRSRRWLITGISGNVDELAQGRSRPCMITGLPTDVWASFRRPHEPIAVWNLAWLTSRILGVSTDEFVRSMRRDGHSVTAEETAPLTSNQCRFSATKKVPPLVSDVRESETALPPGLKRYAG